MADELALSPYEAGLCASNAYYMLGGWAAYEQADKASKSTTTAGQQSAPAPTKPAGRERTSVVRREVTGSGKKSLQRTGVEAHLQRGFEAETGFGTRSGFGYILTFRRGAERHTVIATRGTRPEMVGAPDLLTDLYATPSSLFLGNPVHRGFSLTFDSMRQVLLKSKAIEQADYVHCVGHSLGGAVANLVAAFTKSRCGDKSVRLYTFGAPRVGTMMGFPRRLEQLLGRDNIYRVSHHMDPITMIPTFPYVHVLGDDGEANNIILPSPSKWPVMQNHSMDTYAATMQGKTWSAVRGLGQLPSFEDRLLHRIWNSDSDGAMSTVGKGAKLLGASLLWVLMRLLKAIAKAAAGLVVLGMTAVDLIVRLLMAGLQTVGRIGRAAWNWIKMAASWAGIAVAEAADVTAAVLRWVLQRMLAGLRTAARAALDGILHAAPYSPMFPGLLAGGALTLL